MLNAWARFTHFFALDSRKEHPIEQLVAALSLLLKHREHAPSAEAQADWI